MAEDSNRTGRRPLILSEEIQKAVLDSLMGGNYLETAAAFAGISRATLFDWLDKGRKAHEALSSGNEMLPNGQLYADFLDAVEIAQAKAEVRMVAVIQSKALDNWQAAAWWLERAKPRKYGRLDRAEVTGAEGNALKVDMSVERIRAANILAEIAERRENGTKSAGEGEQSLST